MKKEQLKMKQNRKQKLILMTILWLLAYYSLG